MSNKIQNTINHALGDGARAAKFRCFINIPGKSNNTVIDTLCKSSSFPGKAVDTIDFKHKGKSVLVPGQEKYTQQWVLTFYLEEEHDTRRAFEDWMRSLNYESYSGESYSPLSKDTYSVLMGVSQLNYDMDKEVIQYILHNAFPIEISQVELSSDSINNVLEYTVTFAYSHYSTQMISGGLNSNEIASAIKNKIQELANKALDYGIGALKNSSFGKSVNDTIGSGVNYLNGSLSKIGTSISNFLG